MISSTQQSYKDEEILALSLERPSLFEVLVDRYKDPFLRTAQKIVKQKEEAEDIVQESFTKIYFNAKKFRKVEGASFKSWAYKILINISLTHYKKLKKERGIFERVDLSIEESFIPAENIGAETETDIKKVVSDVLETVPLHLKNVLNKYYLEDKSQKDIAQEEGVSLATIKMRLFRARQAFKKSINENKNILCTAQIC